MASVFHMLRYFVNHPHHTVVDGKKQFSSRQHHLTKQQVSELGLGIGSSSSIGLAATTTATTGRTTVMPQHNNDDDTTRLAAVVRTLKREKVQLRTENTKLRKRNEELEHLIGVGKSLFKSVRIK